MSKGFEVRELDKGYDITVYPEDSGEIYQEPKRGVASTPGEVKKYFNRWMDDPSNFSFEEN